MSSACLPPLHGLRVIEFAGLAPVPFASLLLTDFGATTLRIDRPSSAAPPAPDTLTRGKSSLSIDLKSPDGIALVRTLVSKADVLLDPFRPGVLESLNLEPSELLKLNPRLIYARLTGFRRDDKEYGNRAGHDINYLAISGVLSLLGPPEPAAPNPPINLLADFAGGGLMAVVGILLALVERERSGKGQVVDTAMTDGVDYIAAFIKGMKKAGRWGNGRGRNLLDGGVPFYGVYATKDGKWMSVGALEPQFYEKFIRGLFPDGEHKSLPNRMDPRNFKKLRQLYTKRFLTKTRAEWEEIFGRKELADACVAPVLELEEAEKRNGVRPPTGLERTPGRIPGLEREGRMDGIGAKKILEEWGVQGVEAGGVWKAKL